jgi:excisionase family DNA binding protein
MTELLTVAEVAALLRTSPSAIYHRTERGALDYCLVRDGSKLLFRRSALRRRLGLTTVPPPPTFSPLASTGSDKEP